MNLGNVLLKHFKIFQIKNTSQFMPKPIITVISACPEIKKFERLIMNAKSSINEKNQNTSSIIMVLSLLISFLILSSLTFKVK